MEADTIIQMLEENIRANQARPEMSLADINEEIAAYRAER